MNGEKDEKEIQSIDKEEFVDDNLLTKKFKKKGIKLEVSLKSIVKIQKYVR